MGLVPVAVPAVGLAGRLRTPHSPMGGHRIAPGCGWRPVIPTARLPSQWVRQATVWAHVGVGVGPTGATAGDGIRAQDLLDAVQEEYREGEMLPPDDAAEEWLKLLDHHPEQVVGVSSFRRGRPTEERLVNQII